MIYLFIWENYFRKKILKTWKNSFATKFSPHNIIHISNVFDYELWFFEQNLLSNWFFSEKNLFIIDDFPFGSDEENSSNSVKIQEYFTKILPKINQENIVVFNNSKVDKRSKLYKEISKIWETKDFSINDEKELYKKIKEVYKESITPNAISKIIELKWLNFSNITNEIDKILITKDIIDVWDLSLLTKDVEESIFEIINDLLNLETKKAILKLRELNSFLDNHYFLYNSLASNLRVYFYIFKLKILWKNSKEIKEILDLWNRSFLVDKNYKIDKSKFVQIYQKIASIDAKIKTWKMIWNENEDFMYEIEKSFI